MSGTHWSGHAALTTPWLGLLTSPVETFDEVLVAVRQSGATLWGLDVEVTISRIEPGRWCARNLLHILAHEIRELRFWAPLRASRVSAEADDARARAMIRLLWRAYRAAMRTRDQRPPRYPACPLCGRPLYTYVCSGRGVDRSSLGCVHCGDLVLASDRALARAHQAAAADGLSPLPATFREPKTWLYVADLDDGAEELERARRSQTTAKEVLWARREAAEGR